MAAKKKSIKDKKPAVRKSKKLVMTPKPIGPSLRYDCECSECLDDFEIHRQESWWRKLFFWK